jgi:hypothetical protein
LTSVEVRTPISGNTGDGSAGVVVFIAESGMFVYMLISVPTSVRRLKLSYSV